VLFRSGRPPETRFLVIEARQLHKQGLDWPEVERRLFAERLHSTGRSIDREVELFENTLKRYGVKIDT
jgi:hypothetical protein